MNHHTGGPAAPGTRPRHRTRVSRLLAAGALTGTALAGMLVSSPAAHATAPSGTISYAQAEGYWIMAGGSAATAPTAAAIAQAESSLYPGIIQQLQPYNSTGWGLWQITAGDSVPQFGVDYQMLDAYENAEAAVAKYQAAGNSFAPWSTYSNGSYANYLQSGVTPATVTDTGQYVPVGSAPTLPGGPGDTSNPGATFGGTSSTSPDQPVLARFSGSTWTFYEANSSPGSGSHGSASTDSYVTWSSGLASDVPIMADWQGIGKKQPVLARFSGGTWTFYMSNASPGLGGSGAASTASYVTWSGGLASDVPMMVDWQGINKAEPVLARFSGGTWTYYMSTASPGIGHSGAASTSSYVTWSGGLSSDVPVMADWQGINKATPALLRYSGGTWTYYESTAAPGAGHSGTASTSSYVTWSGGLSGDLPALVDWQGIGKATPALYRFGSGTWTYYLSTAAPGAGHSGAASTDSYVTWSGGVAGDVAEMADWK